MYPKFLWFLMLSYSMVIVLSNWFDPRLICIFGLVTDAGTVIFPLTFLLSDLITEVYGYKHARRAIWCGVLFNLFFIAYSQLIIHLPSPGFATKNSEFDMLLSMNVRIIAASIFSYFCAEPLNAFIMAKLKIKMQGRLMWLRFISSTLVASGVDSMVFGLLAFYGTMSGDQLLRLIFTMWLIKILIEVAGIPISIRAANRLKTIEKLDIYDKKTNFNIFSFEANYSMADNAIPDKNNS